MTDEEPKCPCRLVPLKGGSCWNMECDEPDRPIHPSDKWEGIIEFARGMHEARQRREQEAKKKKPRPASPNELLSSSSCLRAAAATPLQRQRRNPSRRRPPS